MKEFKNDELDILEKYSDSYDEYLKLKQYYVECETFEILQRRFLTYSSIKFLLEDTKLTDFKNFQDFERFIFDNKRILMVNAILSSSDKEYQINKEYRLNFNHNDLKRIVKKIKPNLNQPFLDKAISLFKKSSTDLKSVLNHTMEWIENKHYYLNQKISFDSYKTFEELDSDIIRFRKNANILKFLEKMPKTFQKSVRRAIDNNIEDLETLQNNVNNLSFELRNEFFSNLTDKHSSYSKIYSELYSFNKKYFLFWERIKVLFVPFSRVVYYDNTKLIIKINLFISASILGTTNWCLARGINHWKSYVGKRNNFYIIYNLKEYSNQMVGLTMSNVGHVSHVYNQNNSSCSSYQHQNYDLICALQRYNERNFFMRFLSRFLSRFFIDLNGFRNV